MAFFKKLTNIFGTNTVNNSTEKQLLKKDGTAKDASYVRCVVLSDTHNNLQPKDRVSAEHVDPNADVFIHCGDITKEGTPEELEAFNEWLDMLPHKIKIVIPGNHDLFCDPNVPLKDEKKKGHKTSPQQRTIADARRILSNCTHYLVNEIAEIDLDAYLPSATPGGGRTLVVYGSPLTSKDDGYYYNAFGVNDDDQVKQGVWGPLVDYCVKNRPVDVLLTHGPPHGIHDQLLNVGKHKGSTTLTDVLEQLTKAGAAPQYHCFGHIHEARGVSVGAPQLQNTSTVFINASSVNALYQMRPSHVVFDVEVTVK